MAATTEEDAPMSDAYDNARTSQPTIEPVGPICNFGVRLAYTYYSASNMPSAEELNAQSTTCHFFTIDAALVYLSFYQDWGPLNVAMFYRFSLHLHGLLESEEAKNKRIVLYSSDEHDKKANAALLIALYAAIVLRWSPAEALHPIAALELRPFRDAGYARADFHLSVQDCLFGIKKAVDLRLLKLDEFDVREYEHYEKVENGDWNFITPHFLAFASPVEPNYNPKASTFPATAMETSSAQPIDSATTTQTKLLPKSFKNVLEQFTKKNIKTVIRLNKKLYNKEHFTSRGMTHVEMFYEDGTNPTMEQCRQFIDIAEHTIHQGGVVAVHCKAGLGRTGTLIGAYMIYKWGFTANEAIALQRFVRPGCVVGPQQHFLYQNQHVWVRWAALDSVNNASRSLPPALVGPTVVSAPDTPPSETELNAPTTQAAHNRHERQASVHVPGQPRKTPGAKSRHAIALPETNDEDLDPADDLMLIKTKDTPPELNGQDEVMQIDVEASQEAHDAAHQEATASISLPNGLAAGGPSRHPGPVRARTGRPPHLQGQFADGGRPPSRIAKASTRTGKPLVSIPDSSNRPQSGTGPESPGTPGSVPRSKAMKDLGVYADKGPERYNLRQNRSPSGGHGQEATEPTSSGQVSSHISPSKLPTRTISKRKGGTGVAVHARQQAPVEEDVFGSTPVMDATGAGKMVTRSSRRKKSSGSNHA